MAGLTVEMPFRIGMVHRPAFFCEVTMSYPADLSGPSALRTVPVMPPPAPLEPPPVPSAPPSSAASDAAQRQRELAELQARLRQLREQIAAMLERLRQAQEAEAAARAAAQAARETAQRTGNRDDVAKADAAEATAATRKAQLNEAALALDAHDKHIALNEAKAAALREPGQQHEAKVQTAQAAYDDARQLHDVGVADVAAKEADARLGEADRAVTALAPPGTDPASLSPADQQALRDARGKAGEARRQSDRAAAALETQWRGYERDAAQRELASTGRQLDQAAAARERARSQGDAGALQRAEDAYGSALDAWWVADRKAAAAQASWDAQVAANDLATRQDQHRADEARANQCLVAPPELAAARQTVEQRNASAQAAAAQAQAAIDDQAARGRLRERAGAIETEYGNARQALEQARAAYESAGTESARDDKRIAYADAQDRMAAARADHQALQALRRSHGADGALVDGLRARDKGGPGTPGDKDIAALREAASQARATVQRNGGDNADGSEGTATRQARGDELRRDGGAAQRALPSVDEAAAAAAQSHDATVRRPGATRDDIDSARLRRDETRLAQAVAHGRSDALAATRQRRAAEGEYALALDAHTRHDFGTPAAAPRQPATPGGVPDLLAGNPPTGPSTPRWTGPSLSTPSLLMPDRSDALRPPPWTVLPGSTPGTAATAGANATPDASAGVPGTPALRFTGSGPTAVKDNGRWYLQYPLQMSPPGTLPVPGNAPSRVEMDPVTARVWQAHSELQQAIAAEDTAWRDYQTLRDDSQAIAQARRDGADGGGNDPELARLAGQTRTDHDKLLAALGTRFEAEDRARDRGVDAGSDQTVVSAREELERARAAAAASAAELERYRSQRDSGNASDELERRRADHQAWKAAHPYLREEEAPTWAPLQRALDRHDGAHQQLVREAAEAGAALETRALTARLAPEQRDDPKALYELFLAEPRAMAQGVINAHYADYGGRPYEMAGRTHARNMAGLALGVQPTVALQGDAQTQTDTLRNRDIFAGIGDDYADMLDVVADQLVEQGGEHARVTLLPVVYASPDRGITRTMLFKVDTARGPRFVDEAGRAYDDLRDYRNNNTLPAADAVLAMPRDGDFTVDGKGNVELEIGDARIESGWESFRRKTHLDTVAAAAGIVAGVVLVVGSGGTLAPVAMAVAGAATAYGVGTSAASIADQLAHGQTWNPDKNPQMLIDGLNILAATLGVRAGVAGVRAATTAQRAVVADSRGLADHASQLRLRADTLQQQATRSGRQALGVGAGVYGYSAHSAWANWDRMTPAERQTTRTQLLLGGVQFLVNPVSGRWIRQGATGALAGTRHAAAAWRGMADRLDQGAQSLSTLLAPLRSAADGPLAAVRMRMAQWGDRFAPGSAGTPRGQGTTPAPTARTPAARPDTGAPPPDARAFPVSRSRWRALQDRLSRVDTLGMLNWLDAGRRGAAQAIGKQRDAEARLVRVSRQAALADGETLHRWLSGPLRQQMRRLEARAQTQLAQLRRETDVAHQDAIRRELRRLDTAARRLATTWQPVLTMALRQESRRLQVQQREFKGSATVLEPRAQAIRHLRGELQQWRAALAPGRATVAHDADALTHAQALVTRIAGHRAALADGTVLVARTLDAMRMNRDTVLDLVPKGSTKPVRATIAADIHAIAPHRQPGGATDPAAMMPALPPRWRRVMAATLRQGLRLGLAGTGNGMLRWQARRLGLPSARGLAPAARTPAQTASARAEGMTWSTVLRSRARNNGALNRLDAGRAVFYQQRASTLAAKAAAAANIGSKLAAWQRFVDAVAAHSPAAARQLAAAGGVRERYQGGEPGTVRRWQSLVPDRAEARRSESAREVRRAYADLLLAAARVRKRDTRRAAAASLRAWRQAMRSADDAARVTDALARQLGGATPGTATHRALGRQHALAAQAQRLAETSAQRAAKAVFGDDGGGPGKPAADGALAALRDTHPAAWRRVLERAARQFERAAQSAGTDSPWSTQAARLRALAQRAAADPRLARVDDGIAAIRQWRRAEWRRADASVAERQAVLAWRRVRAQARHGNGGTEYQSVREAMQRAAASHREARQAARTARHAAFGRGTGALDRLAIARPGAADSLLAWAQRQQRVDPRLRTVPLTQVRRRHGVAASLAMRGGAANARGDSTLTFAQLRRGLQHGARAAALAHGAYAAATGQVEVSRDPSELRKYNLPDTTRIDGWQVTFRSRDGLNSMTLWLNIGGIKSLWVGGSTTPFAFSRDGKTTVGTRDGVNIAEGGVAYRFGLPWLSKMGMASVRVGHVKHNILRTNFANGRLADVDGQATWSWPITPVLMDATNIGPLRFYGSNTGNRLQLGQYGRKPGSGELWYLKGPDLSKSRVSEIDAVTLNKEFQWPDWSSASARKGTPASGAPGPIMVAGATTRHADAPVAGAPGRDLSSHAAAVLAGYHRVAPGETLWEIAQANRDSLLAADDAAASPAAVGEGGRTELALDKLLQLNAGVVDTGRLVPGWLLDVAPGGDG